MFADIPWMMALFGFTADLMVARGGRAGRAAKSAGK